MSIIMRLCCLLLLLSASACIGSSLNSRSQQDYDLLLNKKFIGMTRDQLIVAYGPPNRTLTLDNGSKLMQYNVKRTRIDSDKNRFYSNCELRLWLRDKKVVHVDYLGDQDECVNFAHDARHSVIENHYWH